MNKALEENKIYTITFELMKSRMGVGINLYLHNNNYEDYIWRMNNNLGIMFDSAWGWIWYDGQYKEYGRSVNSGE